MGIIESICGPLSGVVLAILWSPLWSEGMVEEAGFWSAVDDVLSYLYISRGQTTRLLLAEPCFHIE